MTGRLTCYREIARIQERRQALCTAELGTHAEPIAGGWMTFSGPDCSYSTACGLGMEGPTSGADIDRLVEFYVSRGVEPEIKVAPFAHPSLLRGLGERGFVVRKFVNVLARQIRPDEDFPEGAAAGWAAGLKIVRVDPANEEQVRLFIEVESSGFLPPGGCLSTSEAALALRQVAHPAHIGYLAFVRGQPAGAAGMFTKHGAAAMLGCSVVPHSASRESSRRST